MTKVDLILHQNVTLICYCGTEICIFDVNVMMSKDLPKKLINNSYKGKSEYDAESLN